VHNDSRAVPDSAEADRPLSLRPCAVGGIALASCGHRPDRLVDKRRGGGLAIVGSGADAPATRAGLAGILARPVHGQAVDTPGPAGLARAYRERMPSAATAVELYGEGDSGETMRLELLASRNPRADSGSQSGPAQQTFRV
jgi:hypothetical protein